MAKKIIARAEFSASNEGVNAGFVCGTKLAIVPANFVFTDGENEKSFENCSTITYKGFANSFCCLIKQETALKAYLMPTTTLAGRFESLQKFSFEDGTEKQAQSPICKGFDNLSLFSGKPTTLQGFTLIASATGELPFKKKDSDKNVVWTMWGVKESKDDVLTLEDGFIHWGDLKIAQNDYDEQIADLLATRVNP